MMSMNIFHMEGAQLTAIRRQHILMYGLNRSPMRAHFQNTPKILSQISLNSKLHERISYPFLFLSMIPGNS